MVLLLLLLFFFLVSFLFVSRYVRSKDYVSPLPLLGCALAFEQDPVSFLCSLSGRCRAVTLNMAGLHLRLLIDALDIKFFYRAREDELSSSKALRMLGFADTLGELNVEVGGKLHSSKIRLLGNALVNQITSLCKERTFQLLDVHEGNMLEVHRFCREVVLSVMVEVFVGPQKHGFADRYLDFQLTHEVCYCYFLICFFFFVIDKKKDAVAKSMALGRFLAWPWLKSAQSKRLKLMEEISPTSEYANNLGEEFNKVKDGSPTFFF